MREEREQSRKQKEEKRKMEKLLTKNLTINFSRVITRNPPLRGLYSAWTRTLEIFRTRLVRE